MVVVVMVWGVGCLVWIPAYAGMTVVGSWVGYGLVGWWGGLMGMDSCFRRNDDMERIEL